MIHPIRGYHQSLKITAQGLMLNIDTAATSFLSAGPVADMLAAMLGVRSAGQLPAAIRDNLRKVQRALRGVKVETTGPGGERQVFVVSSVTSEGADKLTFPNRETGKNESVAHYFSSTKRQLRTPGLQCLDVGRVDR